MPFKIVRNDIVKMETQAMVNAANTSLQWWIYLVKK